MSKLDIDHWNWYVIPYTDETPLQPREYLYFNREEAEQEAKQRNIELAKLASMLGLI